MRRINTPFSMGVDKNMRRLGAAAASAAVLVLGGAAGAYAADLNAMPVKALPAAGPATCTSIMDFFTTACQVAAYGVRFYGTVDVGVSYQTNSAPFDRLANVNYFPGKNSIGARWLPGFNALTPSNFGFQIKEPLGLGWSFVGQIETAWLPYSGQLLNGVHSVYNMAGVPVNQQTAYGDSNSQGAFYNGLGFAGFSNDTWGTITFMRQNSLGQDLYLSYDPMGVAPAFSVPGFFGGYAGGGDTENRKDTTAIKYRVNVANWHVGAYGQAGGYDEGNAAKGAVQGNVGADFNVGPGVFSADVAGGYRKDAVSLGLVGGGLDKFGDLNPNATQTMQATISDNTNVIVGAKYAWDRLKLYAGYEWIQFANADDTYANHAGFTDIAGDFVCSNCGALNLTNIVTNGFSHGDKIQQFVWSGAKYSLTDALDLTGAYYHVWQNDYSGGIATATAVACSVANRAQASCAGSLDAGSVLLDWKFSPKWDTYIGVLYSKLNGGMDSGFLANNNVSTTAGLRFRW
jgi:predicted porin